MPMGYAEGKAVGINYEDRSYTDGQIELRRGQPST
jgi:hypothetical protein